ncbi:hypothetical protein Fcan01_15738 [Folsomia candida]|uniref:Uncharacterized protein n=1 Tax=Folsomia candida TaxID=158441 RepID=A0A226DWW3_FOLCA|nr:hypothetical protein Fcan01_15738 [Folsomia candida]
MGLTKTGIITKLIVTTLFVILISNISGSKLPAQLDEKKDTDPLTSIEHSIPLPISRAGKQYYPWPQGACRKDPWHEQMDAFLLAYYVAHRHGGNFENRPRFIGNIFDSVFGRNDPPPPPQVIVQQQPLYTHPGVVQPGYVPMVYDPHNPQIHPGHQVVVGR